MFPKMTQVELPQRRIASCAVRASREYPTDCIDVIILIFPSLVPLSTLRIYCDGVLGNSVAKRLILCRFILLIVLRVSRHCPYTWGWEWIGMTNSQRDNWENPREFSELCSSDFETGGVVFSHNEHLYRTTGKKLGHGGMGSVYLMARKRGDDRVPQAVVGKLFHSDYLLQLRTDEMAKVEHERVMTSVDTIAEIDHPHLLPTFISQQISDNHLIVSPLRAETLREVVARENLSPRARVELLIQAMRGISVLHENGFLHRDFTLRNILVDAELKTAYLFDFDLALDLSQVRDTNYKKRFQGRIFGSPGYSLVPEVLDEVLMTSPIGTSHDIYAMGTSIFSLFTEDLPYGEAVDLWSLLLRVSKGIVRGGRSYIDYPNSVPKALRPVIEGCMQRVPAMRYKSASEVISALEEILPQLDVDRSNNSVVSKTMNYGDGDENFLFGKMVANKSDAALPLATATEAILRPHGYVLRRSLGKIKDREIFAAAPDPQQVALGHFPDGNPYPKIVTVLDLRTHENPQELADKWLSVYQPALEKARQGLMTQLHRVIYDNSSKLLLLLSEYVEDARFGKDLAEEVLELQEAFGLTYLISQQIAGLHENGLAHNNVCAESLLLKGIRDSHCVHPAMVGIVHPSESPSDMRRDSQELAALLLSWISDAELGSISQLEQSKIGVLRTDLQELAGGPVSSCDLSQVSQICKDALATLDFNFGVLNEHGGDLHAYALTLVSHSLYARLWH